ncbi:hypothetical protein J1N09_07960 [Aureitalea sp. L0-47]|uniref:hypothetical protein n=1 Tax=Aureitalea sp. L0-47 TaxID=2816962 RepID=UPI0022376B05|nr:hypothetical protein [Aureitalea sp. L0-47]MCW5519770.1 hypothetical protein [Aureitalea sp. L0-47]
MRVNLIFVFLCFFFGKPSYGQDHPIESTPADSTELVPFVAYWSIGDSFEFNMRKIEIRWEDDILVKSDTLSRKIQFEVIDSTETMYKVKWRFKRPKIDEGIAKNLFKTLTKEDLYTTVIYTTNELGEFIGVENWEAIRKNMLEDMELTMRRKFGKYMGSEEDIENAMKPFREAYSTKEGIEELALKELFYFHFPMGYEYEVDETYEYEEFLSSFVGGEGMRGVAKVTIDNVDQDNGICRVTHEMQVNPEDAMKETLLLLEEMGMDTDTMDESMKTAGLRMDDFNTFIYYYDYGLPMTINTSRIIDIDLPGEKVKREEKFIIDLVRN